MRKIYGIGETVFDIIFKDGQPRAAKAGGAMLNSAVSLGRIGLPVHFISEYGNDDVGDIIDLFLNANGVDTGFVNRFGDGKTKLALAFLDENNNAGYSFYERYPEERLSTGFPDMMKDDILLYGSIYAITHQIRSRFIGFIRNASHNGGMLIYDPNFRSAHSSELEMVRPLIIENMENSVMVRGSDEDFFNIFGARDADEAWEEVSKYTGCLVYTASTKGVFVRTAGFSGTFPVERISPVSTIGAGDNFNAGVIAALYRKGISREEVRSMGEEKWSEVIAAGVGFATNVCLSYENYISEEYAAGLRRAD